MYVSLKRGNKKENDEIKKNNEKEWKDILRIVVINNVYKSWVALVRSVFPNAVNYEKSNLFLLKEYLRMKNVGTSST